MINDFSIMLPKKNIEKLFVDEKAKTKNKNIVQPLMEKVKSIIKK